MLFFCEEQENSSHFLVLSTKACLASFQHHLPTAEWLQTPQGMGLLPCHGHSWLWAAGSLEQVLPGWPPWPAADEEVWKAGDLEGVLYQHTQVMETGNTCGEWPGQAGAAVALLLPLSEAGPQGCRGCRTWELQLGGPTEEEEERMWEVFYCVPVQCCPLCIQIRAAHSYIK